MSWRRRSIFSSEGHAYLHAQRQATAPTDGNRSFPNTALAALLVVTLMAALFSLVWVQRDEIAFLRSLSGVSILQEESFHWNVNVGPSRLCSPYDFDHCARAVDTENSVFAGSNLYDFDIRPYLDPNTKGSFTFFHLKTVVARATWSDVKDGESVVINLYPFKYDTAVTYLNGIKANAYYNGERLLVKFKNQAALQRDMVLDVVLAVPGAQKAFLAGTRETALLFVAPESRFRRYEEVAAAARNGHGKQLADIARVVMGVFCLLLFIFIDSSPESLGLSLFMGIKATGVILARNWLPESWLNLDGVTFLQSALLCFGDIIQLYFFTQLARVARPNLKFWFLLGIPLAGLYAAVAVADSKAFGVNWSVEVWRWRNVSIGLACMAVALTAAAYTFEKKLYYRSGALMLAFLGTIVQVVYPLAGYFPAIFEAAWFRTFYNIMETQTPYVFALSTFINLTTLESRVRSLSREVVSAKEIEREMALGKTVQQSFLRLPNVPDNVEVICEHEAALYVSGDIYFVNFDASRNALTLLINDVTGHGVQAALKASICSTIADSIWAERQVRVDDAPAARFRTYDMRLHAFLSKVANQDEMVALIGAEFNLTTGTLGLYRVNGIFPVIIEPTDGDPDKAWSVKVLPVRNRELTTHKLRPGGFALLLSDGYIDNSRSMSHFQAYMSETLRTRPVLSAAALKAAILGFGEFAKTNDDKTMLVLRYKSAVTVAAAADYSAAAST